MYIYIYICIYIYVYIYIHSLDNAFRKAMCAVSQLPIPVALV